jgi:hypothetical protein
MFNLLKIWLYIYIYIYIYYFILLYTVYFCHFGKREADIATPLVVKHCKN